MLKVSLNSKVASSSLGELQLKMELKANSRNKITVKFICLIFKHLWGQ